MVSLDRIEAPTTAQFLIGFTDLRGFLRVVKKLETSERGFAFLDRLAFLMEEVVTTTSGRIMKYIGDAALIVYPGEDADAGVRNLLRLKQRVDADIADQGLDSRLKVAAHYGEATIGPFGPQRLVDIHGDAVNRAALAERGDHRSEFVITPEAFRRLESGTRKTFRKHTPPIVYVTR